MKDGLNIDAKELKSRMVDIFKEKVDNHNVHKDDEKSSRLTKEPPKVLSNKRR